MQKYKLIAAFVLVTFVMGAHATGDDKKGSNNGSNSGKFDKIKGIAAAGITKAAEDAIKAIAAKIIFNPIVDKISETVKPITKKIFPGYYKKKKLQAMLEVHKKQAEALAALKAAGAKGKKYNQAVAKVEEDLNKVISGDDDDNANKRRRR